MWVSRKAWRNLESRVDRLQEAVHNKQYIYVPSDNDRSHPVPSIYGDCGHHAEVYVVVEALAKLAGLRWNKGEPGKLVAKPNRKT